MWDALVLLVRMMDVFRWLPKNKDAAGKVDKAFSNGLDRVRWLIWGLILFSVVMLVVAWIAIIMAG